MPKLVFPGEHESAVRSAVSSTLTGRAEKVRDRRGGKRKDKIIVHVSLNDAAIVKISLSGVVAPNGGWPVSP